MWSKVLSIFTGGAINSLEKIALEFIETDKESAEAKVLKIKALDPNGKMRRELSRFASIAYGFYLINTTFLLYMVAYKLGDVEGAKLAAKGMTELFTPITASWAAIVSASFGVNYSNVKKGV